MVGYDLHHLIKLLLIFRRSEQFQSAFISSHFAAPKGKLNPALAVVALRIHPSAKVMAKRRKISSRTFGFENC